MNNGYFISIYLDTRRAKSNGKYPVKLRVFESDTKKQKLYPTQFDFTTKEFDSIWNTQKPRTEHKDIRLKIQALETRSNDIAKGLNPFSFEQFERKLLRRKGEGIKIQYHYKRVIDELKEQKRLSTASSYHYSNRALELYTNSKTKQMYKNLTFYDITPKWLEEFETYMKDKGDKPDTIGFYLRPLRALFNIAITEKEIEKETYPFGKRKYQIPASRKVKKALSATQLKHLYETKPANEMQQKAKDFWFLSYNCNGMNIKDIAHLKYKNISDGKIMFYRAKTITTTKASLKPIVVYLNNYITEMIDSYGNKDKAPDNYVFSVLRKDLSPEKQQSHVQNFTRFINQHIKNLCKANDLTSDISTYWARHSFATISIRKGMSLEFMQESLGHKDMATTLNYFAGFDDESKKEFAESLMDF